MAIGTGLSRPGRSPGTALDSDGAAAAAVYAGRSGVGIHSPVPYGFDGSARPGNDRLGEGRPGRAMWGAAAEAPGAAAGRG
jgi:hypothetical protein